MQAIGPNLTSNVWLVYDAVYKVYTCMHSLKLHGMHMCVCKWICMRVYVCMWVSARGYVNVICVWMRV